MTFRTAALSFEMVPPTGQGRQFTRQRRVRLGDVTPNGRVRLDAIARYLQDVSNDDTRDADWSDPHWWVVRRTVIDVHEFPRYLEEIALTTWCGGIGSHWAERRTQVCSLDGRPLVDAAALWVHVDKDTLQPSRVPHDVVDILTESAAGRSIGARLLLRHKDFAIEQHVNHVPWPLRFSDFDVVRHMNNAAYWEVVEEYLAEHRTLRAPLRAIVEHVVQIEQGKNPVCAFADNSDDCEAELRVDDVVHSAMWCGHI